jgi:hypothetical protein
MAARVEIQLHKAMGIDRRIDGMHGAKHAWLQPQKHDFRDRIINRAQHWVQRSDVDSGRCRARCFLATSRINRVFGVIMSGFNLSK